MQEKDCFLIDKTTNMNKLVLFFIGILILASGCSKGAVEKPDVLLGEDQMVNIIYDLSILDAIRTNAPYSQKKYPTSTEFLKQKYKIDSLTFAKNALYYASNIEKYKKIYDNVKSKLEKESKKNNDSTKGKLLKSEVIK